MGIIDTVTINSRINKLTKKKADLTDDSSSIRTINSSIDSMISDVQSFLPTGNSTIVTKLREYKEPYQYSDSQLTNAASYIQKEITYLKKQLSAASASDGAS